jgi:hypothetical protein
MRPKTHPVTGEVIYKGRPLADAVVHFNNPAAGRSALGTTDSSGRFSLMTFVPEDGAVAGTHQVTISKGSIEVPGTKLVGLKSHEELKEAIARMTDEDRRNFPMMTPAVMRWEIPERYGDAATSGLSAEVAEDATKNHFRFELTGEPSGKAPTDPFKGKVEGLDVRPPVQGP